MTLAQIRTLVRRQVNDVDSVEWSDAEMLSVINLAYAKVQKEIAKVDPEAHLFWDYMAATATVSWYPLPATFGVSEVGLKSAATDTVWTRLNKKTYEDIKGLSSTENYYCLRGQWLGIFPAPSTTVANGIELIHTPIMALALDADIPRIKLPLHEAVAYWTKDILLGDTDEDSAATRQRLADIINDIPLWYQTNSDDPDRLQVKGL